MLEKLKKLPEQESFGGIVLIISALLALIVANTGLFGLYDDFLNKHFIVQFGDFGINKPLILWINDGLMAVFFILVGMEVKAEILEGSLSSWKKSSLPALAAIGGMVVPALIYTLFNFNSPYANGWSIPMATDIAFALGVVALLGKRVPLELKIFLLALAIIDDLGAIVVIALFFSHEMSILAALVAGLALLGLVVLNRLKVSSMSAYLIAGSILWVAVLKSGVHATLAGVLIGFAIPMRDKKGGSPLHEYEHKMNPYVNYFILPIFAFANAGVMLGQVSLGNFFEPLSLGILLGLVIGKPLGVYSFVWLAVKSRIASLPTGITMKHIFAVSILCGIGFTMSMFLSGLSFTQMNDLSLSRLSVLSGSVISAVVGYFMLKKATAEPIVDSTAVSSPSNTMVDNILNNTTKDTTDIMSTETTSTEQANTNNTESVEEQATERTESVVQTEESVEATASEPNTEYTQKGDK